MDDLTELMILLCCAIVSYITLIDFVLKDKRQWKKEIYDPKERELRGFFKKKFKIGQEKDEQEFCKITRIRVNQFQVLLSLLKEKLEKISNRRPISPECRLALTLLYLAHGTSRQVLSWTFRMGVSTVRNIVLETYEVIWEELSGIYLAMPNEAEWRTIADKFLKLSGMPNCVGAIDGKHINITCPPNAGSEYFNYKGSHSIVLLAACDANHCFTIVDIGAFGSQSDGGIFAHSTFGRKILNGTFPLPTESALPTSNQMFPHYFVADAAFPLKKHLMRPYPGRNLRRDKEVFNYKLSSARRMIENAFGIMCMRWRILLNKIHSNPKNVDKIVKTVVVLHNFANLNDEVYCPENYVDHYDGDEFVEDLWRREGSSLPCFRMSTGFNTKREVFRLRDILKDYLFERHN